MKRRLKSRLALVFSLGLLAIVAAGCATTDTENVSERPWNSPKGWETGLPSALTEGR